MDRLATNKILLVSVVFFVLLGISFLFRNSISTMLYFGSDENTPDSSLNVSSISPIVPRQAWDNPERSRRIVPQEKVSLTEINKPNIEDNASSPPYTAEPSETVRGRTGSGFGPYVGRDPEEIRPVPEEIKLFTEEQKSQIYLSIKTYAERVKQRPEILEDWLQIGILKKIIGDFEGARDVWEYAGVVSPLNSVSFANLGELYWRYLHEYPKSEKNFLISIKHKPDDTQTYISLSGLYFYSYKEKENLADDVLFDGLKTNPNDVNLMKALASLYEKQKDYSRSLEWWEKVLKNEPNNKDVAKTIEDVRKKIDGLTY